MSETDVSFVQMLDRLGCDGHIISTIIPVNQGIQGNSGFLICALLPWGAE
jgi:hypothetical protein